MFSHGGLSPIQEFALKCDLAITQPNELARLAGRALGDGIRFALLSRGGRLDKLFPEIYERDPEKAFDSDGPHDITTNLTPAEAKADFEQMMAAMARNSLTSDDLFPDEDT